MALVADIIGLFLLIAGTLVCVLGVYGLLRLEDTYNRIHAAGKVLTFGAGGILLSIIFLGSTKAGIKGLATGIFLLLTAPITSHILARVAYRSGIPLSRFAVRDDLAADEGKAGN